MFVASSKGCCADAPAGRVILLRVLQLCLPWLRSRFVLNATVTMVLVGVRIHSRTMTNIR